MRTTPDIPDDLYGIVVAAARETGTSVERTIERMLRAGVERIGPG